MPGFLSSMGIALKVRLMVVLTVTLAVTVTAMVLGWKDHHTQKREFIRQASMLADLIAQRSVAAVAFMSEQNASENLASLHVMGNIKYACLYNHTLQRVVAEHSFIPDSNYRCEAHLPVIIGMRDDNELYIHKPMFQQGTRIGNLVLILDASRLQERLVEVLATLIVSAIASCAFALLATLKLQRGIYQPIVELSKVTRDISRGRKWALRARKTNDDELGELVDVFNNMVAIIERDQKELENLAFYDPLTDLPNRRNFEKRIENVLARAREEKTTFAVLFIDLDDFKGINDSYGHDHGDLYLVEVAKRLKSAIRFGDTVARIGGDEFTIIAEDIESQEEAETLCKTLLAAFENKIRLNDKTLPVSISIGVALADEAVNTIYEVLKHADIALYNAKNSGKNTWSVYRNH